MVLKAEIIRHFNQNIGQFKVFRNYVQTLVECRALIAHSENSTYCPFLRSYYIIMIVKLWFSK